MISQNPVIQYLRLQLYPTLARLFGKRRRLSSLCLFLTLFLCALLLFSLSFIFAQNHMSMTALEADYDAYITAHGVTDSNQLFRESVRIVLANAKLEIYVTHFCFMCLWLVMSLAAVCHVFGESVAVEKYIYALYIIYGADTKRLKRSIVREFWIPAIPALILSLPCGVWICRTQYDRLSLLITVEILLAFGVLSLLCAERITQRLFRESCVRLMSALDTSEYINSPRRISLKRTLQKKNALSLSFISFGRMKAYRIRQAFSLSLMGAVLFSMTALTLPDNYATQDTSLAYLLRFESGISYEDAENEYLPAVESLEAVVMTEKRVSDTADQLGTHLRFLPRQIADDTHADLLALEDAWALDTVKIACGDGITEKELGEQTVVIPERFKNRELDKLAYTLDTLQTGEAAYLYPEQNGEPSIQIGDTVKIAIPDEIEGYDRYGDHITVKITELIPVGWVYTLRSFNYPEIEKVCPRIFEDYLFLSPEDYGRISQIPQTTPSPMTEADAETLGLTENNCYLLLPPSMKQEAEALTHITTVTPKEAVKKAFTSFRETDGEKPTLSTDTYFINETSRNAGIYFGKAQDYESSVPAVSTMKEHMDGILDEKTEEAPLLTQYQVKGISFCDGLTSPCVIFTNEDSVIFSSFATELSAMCLKSSGCMDLSLYLMAEEVVVVTSDDGNTYPSGTSVMLTTDIPDDFTDAMAEAEISLNAAKKKYQLTESRVITSFRKANNAMIVLSLAPNSLLVRDGYPVMVNGAGSYLPTGDRFADSILTLSDIDSMLVFNGNPKNEKANATVLLGDFVTNQYTLTTEHEEGLSPTLGDREVILRLPSEHPFALTEGDLVYTAPYMPLTLDLTQMDLHGGDLLAYQLDVLHYSYLPLTLKAVEADSSLTTPMLIVSENTFCRICGREDVISELAVFVDSGSTLEALAELSEVISQYIGATVTLDTNNAVLLSRATGSQRYPRILRAMILPLCLFLILIPLSSARTLHLRRERERSAYIAAGRSRKMQFCMCLGEGLWASLLSGGLYALLCPTFVFLLKLFCGKFHVPLKPESFSVSAFFLLLGLIVLSSTGTALLSQTHDRVSSHAPKCTQTKGDSLS